ncbi:hypothetical protein AB0I35_15700 [Nocardia sp. NPDC050378]|uniref:hypothetical protein n=1 Tax=Nocardia sp. NPDC050378 TaxID=3155400 RepID=UPI0033FBF64B
MAQQLEHLRTYPTVVDAERAGRLRLAGMYFDVATVCISPISTQCSPAEGGLPGLRVSMPAHRYRWVGIGVCGLRCQAVAATGAAAIIQLLNSSARCH